MGSLILLHGSAGKETRQSDTVINQNNLNFINIVTQLLGMDASAAVSRERGKEHVLVELYSRFGWVHNCEYFWVK